MKAEGGNGRRGEYESRVARVSGCFALASSVMPSSLHPSVCVARSRSIAASILPTPKPGTQRRRTQLRPETFYGGRSHSLVERAIGTACAERIRDPLGSTPIDEMQARPHCPVNNPEAVAGARRAETPAADDKNAGRERDCAAREGI